MSLPGKTVADEFYIHLSALKDVENKTARQAIECAAAGQAESGDTAPNVAKFNLRTGRVSLLAYPDFFDSPFPALVASWTYAPGFAAPTSYRTYSESLNPPILHRKELLIQASHPEYARWSAVTRTAESLGLFDDVATIGFRLNWERLIASKGYRLAGDQFVPIGNDVADTDGTGFVDPAMPVQRHLTALSRSSISAPVQLLVRHGLLFAGRTFFDYGCGRGGDVAGLTDEGYEAKGWDPHYLSEASIEPADVVNLGFVINVIEDPAERIEALAKAFQLAGIVMSVGVMLYGADPPGKPFRDGFLTSRKTFQKYFSQAEFRDYLELVLHRSAVMVGPGVAFVFADSDAEQRFIAGRYRSCGVATRLLVARVPRANPVRELKQPREPRLTRASEPARELRETAIASAEMRLAAVRPVLDRLWAVALDLGRYPDPDEVENLVEVNASVGAFGKALRLLAGHYDQSLLQTAARTRADDVRLLMATQRFAKRPAYRRLEPRLQRDIKAYFGDYKAAQDAGLNLLADAAEPAKILAACKDAAAQGLGWLDAEHSLQLHVSMVERLPAVLRAYVACGSILWNSLSEVQLVKIHIASGKLTLMEFDGFDETPIPLLRRRIKVQVRRLDYDVFEYGSAAYPQPALYRKSRYLNEDYPGYAEQQAFDEAVDREGLLPEVGQGPPLHALADMLEANRLTINDMRLVPSTSIPDLDSRCGANFTYRAMIQCGETQHRLGLPNLPLRPATYNALHALAIKVLDPLIDYFGSIRLTYGFASVELTKHIRRGVAPKLDQHAACEQGRRGKLICDRGGAACDLLVEDEDMRVVADWIIEHLPFDRLYFFGPDRAIHVSCAPGHSRLAYIMLPGKSSRPMPRRFGG